MYRNMTFQWVWGLMLAANLAYGEVLSPLLPGDPQLTVAADPVTVSWPLPRLMRGEWRQLAGEAALRAYSQLVVALPKQDLALLSDVREIAALPLPFYDQGILLEARAVSTDGKPFLIHAVTGHWGTQILRGDSGVIHSINLKAPIRLETVEQAQAYLRLFVGALVSPGNSFNLIDQPDDLWMGAQADADLRAKMSAQLVPLQISANGNDGWKATGSLAYGKELLLVNFSIPKDGKVDMLDDQEIVAGLPLERVEYRGPARQQVCQLADCPKYVSPYPSSVAPVWGEAQSQVRQFAQLLRDKEDTSAGNTYRQIIDKAWSSTGDSGNFQIHLVEELVNQSSELIRNQHHAEAEPLLRRLIPILETLEGSGTENVRSACSALGGVLKEQRKFNEALPYLSRAIELGDALHGPEHYVTVKDLDALAAIHLEMGSYALAEPLYLRALVISEKANGPEHPNTGSLLHNLALLYESMGQFVHAEPFFVRALTITEKALGPEHPFTSTHLSSLAGLYQSMGQYARAEPLKVRALAISEKANGPEHPSTGVSLNNLAQLYYAMGQNARAEPLYQRALAIAEKAQGPEYPDTGTFLNNLAQLYYAMGQYARAEPIYVRALAISEKAEGLEHPSTGGRLNNLAVLYLDMGQYARAEPLYLRALVISEKANGPEHPLTGTSLNNLALLYYAMGQNARAEPHLVHALVISEKAEGPEHPSTGRNLNNLAGLYSAMGDYAKAEPLYVRALAIAEKAQGPEHPSTGTSLNNLAGLYSAMGDYAKAEPLYVRALAIAEKAEGPEHPSTGTRLNNLAGFYRDMGQYPRAEPLAFRAYRIALNAGDPDLLRHSQNSLSYLLQAQSRPDAAIFFGKQAVNTLQGLRANVAGLGKDTLKSFDASIESTYRHLSRLLIAEGRLVESERVLELLKEQEQFQFVRRDASVSALAVKAPLTAFEAAQEQILGHASAPLAKLYNELSSLEDQKARSADEEARLLVLRTELEQAGQAFQKTLDTVIANLSNTRHDKAEDIKEAQGLQNTLRELGEQIDDRVVALYTVVDAEGYSLILTTPEYRRAYSVPIKAEQLNAQIAAFRDSLKDPKRDPRPQAKALLDVILPLDARAELAQARAGTLMWHLDGSLRLLPLAALHDGEQYLMERYRLTTFTSASTANLKDAPKARWTGLGLGVSEARMVAEKQFAALSAVPAELNTVIREDDSQGVIPGQRRLNQDFNWEDMQAQLKRKGKYPLVHIASHFNLEPGNDTMSYLLPGSGEPITLAQLTRQNNLFGGVDLLTLSACETGVGGGKGADGREVDGLSFIAQRQGAKAVVATLWPVADASTAQLMARFYSLRESQKLTKAEALRQAQMALLRGEGEPGKEPADADQRSARRVDAAPAQPAYVTDPKAPFAHPYYWAPFILMGNWL